jgi:phospholipid/cholesterol/gamma-HCH transport system permease protein
MADTDEFEDVERQESLSDVVQQELVAMLPWSAKLRSGLAQLGGMAVMLVRVFSRALQGPIELGEVAYQIEVLGVRSLSIASLTAVFVGLVLALQFATNLARFGIQHTVGKVVVLTLFRELGPGLTALTVGARIGSGIAAELGAMKVTEQIDAIRVLGADPLRKLVFPRLAACLVVLPALAVLADVLGLVAGAAIVRVEYGIPFQQFFQAAIETALWRDFTSGIGKAAVFGLMIALVGCYKGLTVEGGTEGVGRATTETVAICSVAICLADFFLTKLFLSL